MGPASCGYRVFVTLRVVRAWPCPPLSFTGQCNNIAFMWHLIAVASSFRKSQTIIGLVALSRASDGNSDPVYAYSHLGVLLGDATNGVGSLTSDLLIVAVIVLYWVLLGNWIKTSSRANGDKAKRKEAPADQRGEGIEDASPSAEPLGVMQEIDSNFNATAFLAGAQNAYEVILRAYADGEIETLKRFVGPDVFDTFERAIAERRGRQETLHLTFIGMSKAAIVSVVKKGRVVEIGVRFVADVVTATHSTGGMIVAGNARQIVEVADAWVFAREIRSRNLDWKLVATDGF